MPVYVIRKYSATPVPQNFKGWFSAAAEAIPTEVGSTVTPQLQSGSSPGALPGTAQQGEHATCLSLTACGLTTGEIAAHNNEEGCPCPFPLVEPGPDAE